MQVVSRQRWCQLPHSEVSTHHRRAELWSPLGGRLYAVTSEPGPGAPLPFPGSSNGLSRQAIQRIRLRHRGYRLLLLAICTVLLIQPLARRWTLISPLVAILMALMMMLFLTRYSPLQVRKRLLYGLGIGAIISELLWLILLATNSTLALHLVTIHLLIWGLFIATFLLRAAKSLMMEPYVTLAVLMGAAAGYLLIGYLGAFLLHTLLLLQPEAFDLNVVAPGFDPRLHPLEVFPAMVVGSFQSLTTAGPSLARPGGLLASTGCLAITVAGQLYLAVLIALILGRFHHRPRT
jgi:hypothetical protein